MLLRSGEAAGGVAAVLATEELGAAAIVGIGAAGGAVRAGAAGRADGEEPGEAGTAATAGEVEHWPLEP